MISTNKARFLLLVDLREIFSDLGLGGMEKKSSENEQLTGHFLSCCFFKSPEKTVKLVR